MEQRCSDNDQWRRDIPSFIEPRPPLIQNPFMRPRPQNAKNLMENFKEDESEIDEPELVQVYLRMKPCNVHSNLYEVRSDKCLVTSLDTTTAGHGRRTQHNVSRMYTFSHIFNSDCSQKEVFEQVVQDNLKKLVEGQSFTLLTYGASGSGKTYTLMGTVNAPGLIPRSLEYVFKLVDAAQMPLYKPSDNGADLLKYCHQEYELQWVKRLRHVSAPLRDKYRRMSAQLHNDLTVSNIDLANRTKYYVWVSFVEIYNEAIYDLLAPPDKRVKMRIREDTAGNVYVKGVTQAFVRSGEEAYDVMVAGKHNLIVAATGIHAHSSRSHCIFTITMLTENEGEIRTSHVRLCDLAGCERQRATRNTGARMQESRAINSSLHVLERCLHMLRRKQRLMKDSSMVPYRESKLTRLLGSGLSGSRGEAVSMVVTLNPSPEYAQETKHVLSLAAVAQDIQINQTMYTSTLSTLESSTQQDTTVYSNAETMRLRAENERLHYELAQAQARNKELLGSMEETQQETANTMREIVEETKDMMRQYYEEQIDSLKTQMAEMEDVIQEYETKLEKPPAAVTSAGTPSRYLQTKVAQLMREIAILEEKLSEEKLARARAEKEVQHLRDCIEERDAFKETTSNNQDELVLTDSDNDSGDEASDYHNESLEPVFKKDRRSVVFDKASINVETSKIIQDTLKESIEENTFTENISEGDKSNDSLKHDDSVVISKDSLYATGDDECEILEETNNVENTSYRMANVSQTADEKYHANKNNVADVTDILSHTNTDKDRSESEELFNISTKVHMKTQNEVKHLPSALRGTYSTENDKPQIKHLSCDLKTKNINVTRGTYFVAEPSSLSLNSLDFENEENTDSNTEEVSKPKKVSHTFVNKIIKSMKTTQHTDCSLTQFEQLEKAVNNVDNSKDKSTDFVDVNIPRKKRNYFDDSPKEILNTITSSDKQSIDMLPTKIVEDNSDPEIMSSAKRQVLSNYLEGNINPQKLGHLSTAAKLQEKVLFFDNTVSNPSIISKKQEQSSIIDNKSNVSLILSPSKNQEKILYFDANDDTRSNDIVISSSGIEKLTYFDNIDTNIVPPVNKKINDIIMHSKKDQNRSPSIVKDDINKDYKPSSAIKNLLGGNTTSEIITSIHKKMIKKHESVDIFESPQVCIAKAKEIVLGNKEPNTYGINAENRIYDTEANTKPKDQSDVKIHTTANNENIEPNKNVQKGKGNDTEIKSLTSKAKDPINVEMVQKSIEQLDLEQKTRVNIKQEIKIEPACFAEEPKTRNRNKLKSKNSHEKDKIDISVKSNQAPSFTQNSQNSNINENQILHDNNTIYEFDNIVNDLSNVRATEFDLLFTDENVSKKTKQQELVENTTDHDFKQNIEPNKNVQKAKENIYDTEIKSLTSKAKDPINVEMVRKSTEQLDLEQTTRVNIKQEIKLEPACSTEEPKTRNSNKLKSKNSHEEDKIDMSVKSNQAPNVTQISQDDKINDTQILHDNNTVSEFDNIVKDLSNVRATEFDLLFTDESVPNTIKQQELVENNTHHGFIQPREMPIEKYNKEISEKTKEFEETKYNLRHKGKSKYFNITAEKKDQVEEILAEDQSKCENKTRFTSKRNLRLKRQKNKIDDEFDQENDSKLKDIINLKTEFRDVTMGLPVVNKELKDIPSPEKLCSEDENVAPVMGIQSCPSKSVTRSRRKLFTPRAEPLEESPSKTGDSAERLCVPRPSYHRTRARRKL